MTSFPLALILGASLLAAPPGKNPTKKAKSAPVEETPKPNPSASVLAFSIIDRFTVKEELLLEQIKGNPRLTRNALIEMHTERKNAFERDVYDNLEAMMIASQNGFTAERDSAKARSSWCRQQWDRYAAAIKRLNELKPE
jgi:hypothetical protein